MSASVSTAITYARQKAQTDSVGISDTNGLAWANNGLLDISRDLIKRGVNAAQTKEWYTSVASNGSVYTTFVWPSQMWMLKTISVDYSNTGGQALIQADKLDPANVQQNTSLDYIRANQPTNDPQFTNYGDTGEIFPAVQGNTPALIRIIGFLQPTEYASVSDTVNYPQSLDYRVLGDKILESYYQSLEQYDKAKYWGETMYGQKIADAFNILAPQSQQPITPKPLGITGWEF